MYSQDFPNFGGFSLMYKSSNAPLAFKTIVQENGDSKNDMVYVIILEALKNEMGQVHQKLLHLIKSSSVVGNCRCAAKNLRNI